ncbi:MAG TPA: hypothetical protein VHF05_03495 [Candidatus Paceibacterota bacterium]|nr:hypothetical protein [Candidatus Paceibacterota bacterium]
MAERDETGPDFQMGHVDPAECGVQPHVIGEEEEFVRKAAEVGWSEEQASLLWKTFAPKGHSHDGLRLIGFW